ncbi:MAG: hypothetical protein BMS9Abin26_1115 [Gammaproteobacteria bacterium]|nr:MAG: hypothetical protein BMS9Abin26_1115 [Gammaproteobacteria bacterium]
MYNLAIMFNVKQLLSELRDVETNICLIRQLSSPDCQDQKKLWTYKLMQHNYRIMLMEDVFERHYPINE